ncbi:type III secretion system stator protein SctL [Motiliproteus sp. MSK22-1]|uniref:type III secretion system stator protein SctL n=1 Tax=Motiliproteus sp. MSK22-1 TaxID=1897630 RepID=UPI00097569FB|nr:type III secretion system stator protein SctL [Motiliproteus sp. MSK22-1]OMH25627.1 hypothetical protein BGP75_24070 [Motiliproteus sp. MSK22-1]
MGFIAKKLELSPDTNIVNEPLIKQTWLQDSASAKELLRLAEKEFMNAMSEARLQCDSISESARSKAQEGVWEQANELLAKWEEDHSRLCNAIEPMASDLVMQSLKKIFGHLSEPDKVGALVHQLASEVREKKPGVLRVHPSRESIVIEELKNKSIGYWKVETNQSVNEDELILNDENGQYSVSISLSMQRLSRLCS